MILGGLLALIIIDLDIYPSTHPFIKGKKMQENIRVKNCWTWSFISVVSIKKSKFICKIISFSIIKKGIESKEE